MANRRVNDRVLKLDFDRRLMRRFRGSILTSAAGLMAECEPDDAGLDRNGDRETGPETLIVSLIAINSSYRHNYVQCGCQCDPNGRLMI
jgi:hypothetical protein